MVEKFCNIPLHEVLLIKLKEVRDIVNHLNALFEAKPPLQRTFKIGKTKFGMIPNLDEMEFGEYIDLETNITEWETMNKAMAVLFRPIKSEIDGKYEIETYNGSVTYSDVMLFAPLDVVQGACFFLFNLGNELLKATQNYLVEEVMEMATQPKSNSTKNGDGTTQYTLSQKATLETLKQLLDYPYTNA
jgi:hypothetical protein